MRCESLFCQSTRDPTTPRQELRKGAGTRAEAEYRYLPVFLQPSDHYLVTVQYSTHYSCLSKIQVGSITRPTDVEIIIVVVIILDHISHMKFNNDFFLFRFMFGVANLPVPLLINYTGHANDR